RSPRFENEPASAPKFFACASLCGFYINNLSASQENTLDKILGRLLTKAPVEYGVSGRRSLNGRKSELSGFVAVKKTGEPLDIPLSCAIVALRSHRWGAPCHYRARNHTIRRCLTAMRRRERKSALKRNLYVEESSSRERFVVGKADTAGQQDCRRH